VKLNTHKKSDCPSKALLSSKKLGQKLAYLNKNAAKFLHFKIAKLRCNEPLMFDSIVHFTSLAKTTTNSVTK